MLRGRIVSYDGADGLGYIELEDGRTIRFGLTSVEYPLDVSVGARVVVEDVKPGFGGTLRATRVRDPLRLLSPAEKVAHYLAEPNTRTEDLRVAFEALSSDGRHELGRR